MSKKIILVFLIFFIAKPLIAQNSINDYKYVVVPLQFDFLKGKDKYRTSTLTRYLFKNEGFEVYFDEENLPEKLYKNRCLALYADVLKVSSFLNNRVQIQLKDCYDNIIFLSKVGSTKIKEYDKAYSIVIKKAFESIGSLNYKYNPNSNVGSQNQTISKEKEIQESNIKAQAEVERLQREVETLKRDNELAKAEAKQNSEVKKSTAEINIEQKPKNIKSNAEEVAKFDSNLLYAQPIQKGFQLVDVSPKVVMIIIKTAVPTVFTVKGKDAIVFKENDKWFYSENDEKTALNIKF